MGINEALHILQLSRPVSLHDIKKAYRKLALIYHPDKGDFDESYFIQLNKAYEFLNAKTEAEINNIHSFKVAPKRGPVIIPDSLLFADIENLFYIFHFLNKYLLFKYIFVFIRTLLFLPKKTPTVFKALQIMLGFVFTIAIFPFILASFIFLSLPYVLYELFYEKIRSIYFHSKNIKLTKYTAAFLPRMIFISIRLIPALAMLILVYFLLYQILQISNHLAVVWFIVTVTSILFFWVLSIGRDIYISLNRKG